MEVKKDYTKADLFRLFKTVSAEECRAVLSEEPPRVLLTKDAQLPLELEYDYKDMFARFQQQMHENFAKVRERCQL